MHEPVYATLHQAWVTIPTGVAARCVMPGSTQGQCLPLQGIPPGQSSADLSFERSLRLAGGLDLEGKFRNDAFIVDPRSCRWFGLGGIIKNAPPKPRAYHT